MKKKQAILKTAARLFAVQGFDGTTTIQIATEAGVTEPLIYYHFKGKDELFTRIIEAAFKEYFSRLDALEQYAGTPFDQIRNLIELQFDIVEDMPDEIHLIASACPARLNDPEGICAGGISEFQKRNMAYLNRCLTQGVKTGEFESIPVEDTANLLVACINGIVRYRAMKLGPLKNMRETAVNFCRRSLMNGKDPGG